MNAATIDQERGRRSEKEGIVIGNKMDKTVVVRVDATYRDPRYHKVITRGKKYYAHDESNELQVGDRILIKESRPYSKLKRWLVVKKLERNA